MKRILLFLFVLLSGSAMAASPFSTTNPFDTSGGGGGGSGGGGITVEVDPVFSAFKPQIVTTSSLTSALANYLPLGGGTLTGVLTLAAAPAADLQAATKKYVDDSISSMTVDLSDYSTTTEMNTAISDALDDYLPLGGGTLTGMLTLSAAPTADLHAATKKYVDDEIASITVDLSDYSTTAEMTAAITAALTTALADYDTSDEVDDKIDAAVGDYLPLAGGTMTGTLTLEDDPKLDLEAATKHYVDAAVENVSVLTTLSIPEIFIGRAAEGTLDLVAIDGPQGMDPTVYTGVLNFGDDDWKLTYGSDGTAVVYLAIQDATTVEFAYINDSTQASAIATSLGKTIVGAPVDGWNFTTVTVPDGTTTVYNDFYGMDHWTAGWEPYNATMVLPVVLGTVATQNQVNLWISQEEGRSNAYADAVGQNASDALAAHNTSTAAHDGVEGRVDTVEGLIPTQATTTNQLADKDFVNSSINTMASNRVSYNAAGAGFPTYAALTAATTFYHGGVAYNPTNHDYVVVIADENAPAPFTGGQTRYEFDGTTWAYVYGINEEPFTAAQQAAIDSGITKDLADKVVKLPAEAYYPVPDNKYTLLLNYQSDIWPTSSTYATSYTFTEAGNVRINATYTSSSALNYLGLQVRLNGIQVGAYGLTLVVQNSGATQWWGSGVAFDVAAGDVIELRTASSGSGSPTLTPTSNCRLDFSPFRPIEPSYSVFNDMGSVATSSALPTGPTQFDLYHITDSSQDVYARYIDGVLEWVILTNITRIKDSDSPDWDNGTVVANQNSTVFPKTATATTTVFGTVQTVTQDCYVSITGQVTTSVAQTTGGPQFFLRVNSGNFVNGSTFQKIGIARYENTSNTSTYRMDEIFIRVNAGDTLQLGWNTGTSATPTWDSNITRIIEYPLRSGVSNAVNTAFNNHVADTSIHVTAGDKTDWNNKISASAFQILPGDNAGEIKYTLDGGVTFTTVAVP